MQWRPSHIHQHMNVVGHHAPRQELVAILVKIQQGILCNFCGACIPQPALANTTIKVGFQLLAAFADIFNTKQMFSFAAAGGGHRIFQPERDELNEIRLIAMRQVTAFVPAEETEGTLHIGQGMRPLVLVLDQTAKVFAFGTRRRDHAHGLTQGSSAYQRQLEPWSPARLDETQTSNTPCRRPALRLN